MSCVYYTADIGAKVRKCLAKLINICGMVKIFDEYSVSSFLLDLIGMVKYVVLFEVLDEFSICFRRRTM
jgi:hypothetical protein